MFHKFVVIEVVELLKEPDEVVREVLYEEVFEEVVDVRVEVGEVVYEVRQVPHEDALL